MYYIPYILSLVPVCGSSSSASVISTNHRLSFFMIRMLGMMILPQLERKKAEGKVDEGSLQLLPQCCASKSLCAASSMMLYFRPFRTKWWGKASAIRYTYVIHHVSCCSARMAVSNFLCGGRRYYHNNNIRPHGEWWTRAFEGSWSVLFDCSYPKLCSSFDMHACRRTICGLSLYSR